jgi:aminopeptidase-like protein
MSSGQQEEVYLFELAKELFPICRSLTGDGVRKTLEILQRECPQLVVRGVASGTKAFDWEVPDEWNISEAYILDPTGKRIVDFGENNLHVVGYSTPQEQELPLEELLPHLFSREDMPDVIPYVTSYYEKDWGFCIAHNQKRSLVSGTYKVVIRSSLKPGSLNYGELLIPGADPGKEIFLTSYICHPSMGNNELSGPLVLIGLAKWLLENRAGLRNSYRIVFAPETIGALVYLQENLVHLKRVTFAGFVVTCVGDERAYSYLSSPYGNNLSDRVLKHVLFFKDPSFKRYDFLERGSDERQYCAPGVDLPVCSFMRSKYGEYPEYHTSADNLDMISGSGMSQSVQVLRECVEILENDKKPKTRVLGEPQLGKRGLYENFSLRPTRHLGRKLADILAYANGLNTTLEIAELCRSPFHEVNELVGKLKDENLIEYV